MNIDIPVSHGRLEAILWTVESARAAAIVCHPHPKGGGTMHNHLAYRTAAAFRDAGVAALRFNFRGVGRSTGEFDQGRGEVDDAAAALDFLAHEVPGVPLISAGFSFGSRVALQLAERDPRIERVLAVGMAVDLFDFGVVTVLRQPKAFIHADSDEYGKLEHAQKLIAESSEPKKLFVVSDATHLCPGRLEAFTEQANAAVSWLLGA